MKKQERFIMRVDTQNPDAHTLFTVEGTGETKREAAVFALASFYRFMDGDELEGGIHDFDEAEATVNERLWTEGVDEVISSLEAGTIDRDSDLFYNAYETTLVDYEFDEVDGESRCGTITDIKVVEIS